MVIGDTARLDPVSPDDVVLGIGNVVDGRDPDLLVRCDDGSLLVIEADGYGVVRRYAYAFDALIVGVADVTGDGHADLIGLTPAGEIMVYPHTGVFWPQDPATAYGCPVVIGSCAPDRLVLDA
jgi:hypothetical protein